MFRINVIDSDVLKYKCAHIADVQTRWPNGVWTWHGTEPRALLALDKEIRKIEDTVQADLYIHIVSDAVLFRGNFFPDYKANRKAQKPVMTTFLGEYLLNEMSALQMQGLEADDLIGILMTMPRDVLIDFLNLDIEDEIEVILSTIDKDLNTIPGLHHNLTSREIYTVSEADANAMLTKQILTGDRVDNIPGIKGFAFPKDDAKTKNKLEKTLAKFPILLEEFETKDWWDAIVGVYRSEGLSERDALVTAELVKILTFKEWNVKSKVYKRWKPYDGY